MNKGINRNTSLTFNQKMEFLTKAPAFSINKRLSFSSLILIFFLFGLSSLHAQYVYQPNSYAPGQPNTNYMANSTAFRQEIAKVEINVVRDGKAKLPITQVPRLQKDDVVVVRLLDEAVNGVKPDKSNWDWTFVAVFLNPGANTDKEKAVSEEIQFKRQGWYREHSFVVPFDSQPMFFLYSKSNYRGKIQDLISKNSEDLRKVGEKTLEISGAYAKIGSFLNELQGILYRTQYNGYGNYGNYGNYGGYGGYGNYGNYGNFKNDYNFNFNLFMNQAVERLAQSFNIQLPQCWNGYYGGYNNGGYNNGGYNNYGNYNYGGSNLSGANDFVARAQCVAKSVRLEDFDVSVSRMIQQGGLFAATQLVQRFPQLAFWINVAAAALDFILKLTKKAPLRIVPTVIAANETPAQTQAYQQPNNFNSGMTGAQSGAVKISLYAESPPNDNTFVTAFPLVISKWQPNPDPEVIALPTPMLANQCLQTGQNVLRSTDLMNDWTSDNFTRDFKLVVSSSNGFRKEFPLRKNIGLTGWELNLTKEDINSFPKINMILEAEITGKRGFNEVRSPKFGLPLPLSGTWEIESQSQKAFTVGGKRIIKFRNQLGNCRCLQAVVYKPSFGGQFVFEADSKQNPIRFSEDGSEAQIEIDATNFQPGPGQFELRQYGGDAAMLNVTLFPAPPVITDLKIAKGDNKAIITGERLEQIRAVRINGKRAIVKDAGSGAMPTGGQTINFNNSQANNLAAVSQRTVVFENANARQDSNGISLELELEGDKLYPYPKKFEISRARPSIVSNVPGEVEAITTRKFGGDVKMLSLGAKIRTQFDLINLPVFPLEVSEVNVTVQNALTDYDFKIENISIETRIENSSINSIELPPANFEVLDWKNMKISFQLNEHSLRLLGGRRLQFRIRDKQRGDSDWYTIRKTFVRFPQIVAVRCAAKMNGNCEMTGEGIEYISQISVDGGKTWHPQESGALTIHATANGEKAVFIPHLSNKQLLRVRLRDFPSIEGLTIDDYNLISTAARKN